MHAALADLQLDTLRSPVLRTHRTSRLPRIVAGHVSAYVVAGSVALLMSATATAAVLTNHLPGPTRGIAYALGLPVSSPLLYQTQQNLTQLGVALKSGNTRQELRLGHQVEGDLSGLDSTELRQVLQTATPLLRDAGITPTIPPVTAPMQGTTGDQVTTSVPSSDTYSPENTVPTHAIPDEKAGTSGSSATQPPTAVTTSPSSGEPTLHTSTDQNTPSLGDATSAGASEGP
jgi:hypothetical protein